MRKLITILAMAAFNFMPPPAKASVNISINVVQYPALQRIPGYPVYYAPRLHANYFFYDGLYWVYVDDAWYASPWFDGPWDLVAIDSVPLFILRIPVRYYLYRPAMFSGWAINAPPRWDRVWGPGWAHRHANWQRWNRAAAPARPLCQSISSASRGPTTQMMYSGERSPSRIIVTDRVTRKHARRGRRMWAIQAGRHTRGQIPHASRGPRLKRFALRMRKTRTCVQPCASMPNRAGLHRIGKLHPIM